MQEAVTIGERYRKATTTSNLKVEARRTGDVDLLIAAGWSDSLGIKLYRLAGEFDQVATDMHRVDNMTDALLVMSKLKTLNQARIELVRFATECAPRWGVTLGPNILAVVVGRALSAWLDPNCTRCGGTGTIGGYDGKPANVCRRCTGSGKTRHDVGKSDAERYFAHRLMAAMDAKMGEGDAMMRRFVR